MNALLLAVALSSVQPQPTITVKETVITVKAPATWQCGAARELVQGSGTVKVCR